MQTETDVKTVQEAFDQFITYSKAKNLKQRTIGYYRENYRRFKQFLDDRGIDKLSEVDPHIVQSFSLSLKGDIEKVTSVNTILRAVRTFLYYGMKMNYLGKFKVEILKQDKPVKEIYTEEELQLLLKKPDIAEFNFTEYRAWVMVNWYLSTGNRVRTVRNVQIRDLDLKDGFVKLRAVKNRKQQMIPLTRAMVEIIKEYLKYRGGEGVSKTSSHLFRHTFAKLWIKNGGDIFRLQKILGHSSMEMVRNYVNMYSDDLKEGFEKFNPLSQYTSSNRNPITL